MKVRVWLELNEDLHAAKARYSAASINDITRKACRKFNNLDDKKRGEVLEFTEPSTYQGPEMNFNIPANLRGEKTASDLRKILAWYLKEQKKKERQKLPLDLDNYSGKINIIEPENR